MKSLFFFPLEVTLDECNFWIDRTMTELRVKFWTLGWLIMIRIGLGWGLVETIFFSLNMMVPLQGGVWWLHHKLFFNYRYFTISFFLSQKKKKIWGGFLSISQRRTKHPTWWWTDDYINEIIRHAQKSTTTTVLLLRPPSFALHHPK